MPLLKGKQVATGADGIATANLVDASVTNAKLGTSAVTRAKILDGEVIEDKIATDAVSTTKIVDLNVTTGKIAANAVTPAKADLTQVWAFTAAPTYNADPVGANDLARKSYVDSMGGGGSGVTTMAAIGAAPNANAATISGVNLNLEPASASFGGVVTTGTQTFAGAKTFSGTLSAAGLTSSNGSLALTGAATGVLLSTSGTVAPVAPGTNGNVLTSNGTTWTSAAPTGGSGVTTMAAIGSSPNANGASIAGVTLSLEPASASFGGVVTTGTQTMAGAKTWSGAAVFSSTLSAAGVTSSTGALTLTGAATGVLLSTSGTVAPVAAGTSGNVLISNGTTWAGSLTNGAVLGVGSAFSPTSTIHAKTSGSTTVAAETTSSSSSAGFVATNSSGNNFVAKTYSTSAAGSFIGQAFANASVFATSGPTRILFGSDSFGGGAPIYFGVNDIETFRLGLSTDNRATITAGTLATTKQALSITATLPNPGGASVEKVIQKTITLATSANNSAQFGQRLDMVATGYTGSGVVIGQYTYNDSSGTGTGIWSGLGGNWGAGAAALGTTATGHNVGHHGYAGNALLNIGSYGMSDVIGASKTNIGVAGRGINGGAGGVQIGGYFTLLNTTLPTFTSAAIIADNGTQADPIALFRSNGTSLVSIVDGGDVVSLDSAKGFVLKDAAGTPHYWRISVSTIGVLTTADLGTSPPT